VNGSDGVSISDKSSLAAIALLPTELPLLSKNLVWLIMGKYSTFNSNIKVAVDAVIFGYHEKQLQVLLVRAPGRARV
jgi:hypothetical protein